MDIAGGASTHRPRSSSDLQGDAVAFTRRGGAPSRPRPTPVGSAARGCRFAPATSVSGP